MKGKGLLLAVAFLVGCSASTSEKEFQKLQDMTKRSDFSRSLNAACIQMVARDSRRTREAVATVMKVPLTAVPSTYCRRVFNGFASGRLTRADWDALQRGKITDNILRVVRG